MFQVIKFVGVIVALILNASQVWSQQDFYWGVATAAFQSEGFPADSDWREWTKQPGKIYDSSVAEGAVDFWTRYEEDFLLAKELGANAFRISLAWERIEPQDGVFDQQAITHYATMLKSLEAKGITPFVTCFHFVLPKWLADKGGLLSNDFADQFAGYCSWAVKELAARGVNLKYLFTINEPNVLVHHSYLLGIWPPGHKDNNELLRALANMAHGHNLAYGQLKQLQPNLKIGIAKHVRAFHPKTWNPLDYVFAKLSAWFFNEQFINALTRQQLYFWLPGAKTIKEPVGAGAAPTRLDFLGINYYGRQMVKFVLKEPYVEVSEGPGAKTDLDWEIYPQGLSEVVSWAQKYKLPIIISENGIADATDAQRADFLKSHLAELLCQNDPVKNQVFGYLHWSLTDNFEWSVGRRARFGLVEIDYSQNNQRKPRPSFSTFKKLIANPCGKVPDNS